MRILIEGGTVVDPYTGLEGKKDLLVEGDRIVSVNDPGECAQDGIVDRYSAIGCIVAPGLVDIHVHLREPGQEWKETIHSGSEAAVAGGFTDICCMPNTRPIHDSSSVTEFIVKQAKTALCRVHPIGAISMGSKGESLAPFGELAEAGCVAFSDDGWPVMNAQLMRRALEYTSMLPRVLMLHEEDLHLSDGFSMNESDLSIMLGLKGMPEAAENVMIARDIELARLTGGRVHFCHVSTARGVQLIERAKQDGIPVTAEVAPQHLFLTEDEVEGFNTLAKMSMPLRHSEDNAALIKGLASGVIDCVASDHAPHESDSKNIEFGRASFGMIGLQTTVPILFELVNRGCFTQMQMIDFLSRKAWKCLGLERKGIEAGAPADISILDPAREFILDETTNKSKSSNSPLLGRAFKGTAALTMVSGKVVFSQLEHKGN